MSKNRLIAWAIVWLFIMMLYGLAHAASGRDIYIEIVGEVNGDMTSRVVPLIESATAADTITVAINSSGGEYVQGLKISKALLESPAKTIGVVNYEAASAAAQILLATDVHIVAPGATVMFHLPYFVINNKIIHDPQVTAENLKIERTYYCLDQKIGIGWYHYAKGKDVIIRGAVYNKLPKIDCDGDKYV